MEDRHILYVELYTARPQYFSGLKGLNIVTDIKVIKNFEKENNKKIGVLYASTYNLWVVDLVENDKGGLFPYERVIPAKEGGVITIPIYKGEIFFIDINRHAPRGTFLELPRGYGENNKVTSNAIKELQEEIGATVVSTEEIGYIYADTGLTGTKVGIVVCELDGCKENIDYENIQGLRGLSIEDVLEDKYNDTISCGLTLAALTKFKCYRLKDMSTQKKVHLA